MNGPNGGRIRLGTRGSALALAQARLVADALGGVEIVPIKTSGDRPAAGGDKARFVREIEAELLAGDVDLGVHSAKDLPSELPDGLGLAGVFRREDPADAYVGKASSLDEVAEGARIGTSSLRRRAQLLAARPDLEVTELRGNVDTRLRRLADRDFDGIVLAAAGLRRLGREDEIAFALDASRMTPAAGQGALALEARRGDERAAAAAGEITDTTALVELTAERAAVAALDASCRTPVGVRAALSDGGTLRADGFVGLPDGSEWIRDTLEGGAEDPATVGRELAERMLAAGAGELLGRAQAML
jgi:hydroxymethylbilane synthase